MLPALKRRVNKMDAFIKVDNLVRYYTQKKVEHKDGKKSAKQTIKAVDGVSFELEKGEILGVIGESGCGKSTLGRLLMRLEEPTSGDVYIGGVSTAKLLKKDRLSFRKKCQIVFQNPFDTFDPRFTIRKILMDTCKLHKIGNNQDEMLQICISVLEEAGLRPAEDYLDRYPFELSGGQLQRISILRSMLLNPEFLVADEPVSMLDVSVRADIINMLTELTRKKGSSMVFISHDIATTRYISDKVAVMYLGRIVEMGETDEILHHPKHPYTQALISNSPDIDPRIHKDAIVLEGEPPTPINTGPGCYFAPRCRFACEKCFKSYPDLVKDETGRLVSCFKTEGNISNEDVTDTAKKGEN